MRREGQKKEISSDTLLMGPIDYVSGIDLLVSILTKWIMNFSRRLSFWTKTSSSIDSFLYTWKLSIVIVFFFKIAFILIELHLFEAYSIENYTPGGWQTLALNQREGWKKILKGGMLLQKRVPLLKRMSSRGQRKSLRDQISKNNNMRYILESKAKTFG